MSLTGKGGGLVWRSHWHASPPSTVGSPSAKLVNNTIAVNIGSGVCASTPDENFLPTIANCILWGNSADDLRGGFATHSDIESGNTAGTGNLSVAPLFVGGGDYHLTEESPCIDVRDDSAVTLPADDMEGNDRIRGGHVDMGAHESPYSANEPPVCSAGEAITAQCDGVQLSGTASDPDDDPLTYKWTSSCPNARFVPTDEELNPTVCFDTSCGVDCTLTLTVDGIEGAYTPRAPDTWPAIVSLPVDEHPAVVTATGECGNGTSFNFILKVIDETATTTMMMTTTTTATTAAKGTAKDTIAPRDTTMTIMTATTSRSTSSSMTG